MQVLKIEPSHNNFFCPVTGEQITGDEFYEPSSAMVGMWHSDVLEDPALMNEQLQKLWEEYVAEIDKLDEFINMDDFFQKINIENFACFEITTYGIACGPTSTTVWYVINMDFCKENIE